ncbi:MAG: Na+/H+ antiporter NhaC family protein [Clostridia bacterium]|nr:Na+/H+ antiporter NhaC family protein [Clostridia bacterium]
MSKKKIIALAIAAVIIVGLLVYAGITGAAEGSVKCPDCGGTGLIDGETCETCGGESLVTGTLWALLPPIIAIGLALITKEVFSSLFIGIVVGALLYSKFNFLGTISSLTQQGLIDAVSGNAGIFIFLIELGILVALVNKAGGSAAFGKWTAKHIKTKVGALLATFVLGVVIFIDDYFNCLTVGSVMRPVTDSHKISRSKLAYLIDATAAPICMIAPISSWAAAVSSYAEDGKGIKLFISAIPFNFYSLLTLVFIVALSIMGFDYGKMRLHEINAQNGDLFSGEKKESDDEKDVSGKGIVLDLIFPVVVLIVCCILALLYVGGILDGVSFVDAFANTDATVGLPLGGLVALVISIIYFIARKVLSGKDCMEALPKGFTAMVPAIFILTFATALKNMTSLLGAKYFIYNMMLGFPEGLLKILPAVIFLVACVLSFSTGTSWGTFGILIPIVVNMFAEGDPLLIIGMSACLAGAVCGDHCSPISDTTIMASAGAQCEHLNHVSTQLPYALSVAGLSFVMFLVAGFVPVAWICLPIGVVLTVGFLFVMKAISKKKEAKAGAQ